jgi:hypothetical protein
MLIRKPKAKLTVSKSFFALGTINNIKTFGYSDEVILEPAVKRVLEINEVMSVFNPFSGEAIPI